MKNLKKVYYYVYNIENGIIDFNLISNCLNKFFIDIMNSLENNQYVTFQLTYKLSDGTFRTLGYLNKINKNDKDKLLNNLLFFHQNDFDGYNEEFKETISIYIKYKYLDMSKTENKSLIMDIRKYKKPIKTHLFNKMNIPSMYNTKLWGDILNISEFNNNQIFKIIRNSYIFDINQNSNFRFIRIFNDNHHLILEFTDKFLSNNYFIRKIKSFEYHFINDKLICSINNKETKFISKIVHDNIINDNIITLDIETKSEKIVNADEQLSVISCCIYDGLNKRSFYLSDYKSGDDLLINAINSLLIEKYNNYKVYIHNLSSFDGIFLLRILAKLENTKLIPIIKDDKMIALTLKFSKNKITFHDSMLLLPSSLDKLSKAFNVVNKKVIFPINWLLNNPNFSLGYIGAVPEIKYFKDISLIEYNNYVLERFNMWNFRKELLNYNMVDCIALYEILIKFNQIIYEKFNLNAFNYPTLPSLAFAIYRSSFMSDYKIPKIGGKMLYDIRKSYTGGATEMYIPYGKNLYHYDINSLYPTAMKQFKYPMGNYISFSNMNNLTWLDLEHILGKDLFGFIECKIECP
jgi:DNA polymerase type B, organellar and viral